MAFSEYPGGEPAMTPLLSLELTVAYSGKAPILNSLSLEIQRGEILGLVGESGCGKSTLALAILRLLHLKKARLEGSIHFNGRNLMGLGEREMRRVRGKDIALVLQSPMSSLNPALKISSQLEESWNLHGEGTSRERQADLCAALSNVRLPSNQEFLRSYPSQLSVGQAQRVLIAMAVLHQPLLLIADEPTSSLDLLTASQILELLREQSSRLGASVLFISHDLLSVASISQRIAVLKNGGIVECRPTPNIFSNPQHPYTQQLLHALPAVPPWLAEGASAH
jgi:peptide/nickel transport system ATP-binding protein